MWGTIWQYLDNLGNVQIPIIEINYWNGLKKDIDNMDRPIKSGYRIYNPEASTEENSETW